MKRLLWILVLAPAIALAAPPPGKPGPAPGGPDLRERVREQVRAIRTARLIEALSLDEATTSKLFPIMNRFDEQLLPIHRELGDLRREIRAQVQGQKPDNARLNQLVDRALAAREKLLKIEGDRLREIRKVLTPTQMAKAIVVLPEIDRFIQRQIRRAMMRRGGKGGMGGMGGMGGGGADESPYED